MLEIKRKEGESSNSLLFRFGKRVRQSGILTETRKRRFQARPKTKRARHLSAVYRAKKQTEMKRLKKLGLA